MKRIIQLLLIIFISTLVLSGCQNQFAQEINTALKSKPIADAGNSRVVNLPINRDTLRGTATSTNGAIVSYLWGLVSGPNNPTIVSSNASTTVINNLVAGNYIFQFSVIDSEGYMGVDTVSLQVLPAAQQTIVLQPNNNPNETNFLFSSGINITLPVAELYALSYTNAGAAIVSRTAFKFDLSGIPTNALLVSAKLSLYSSSSSISISNIPSVANSGTNNSFWVRRIASNWNNNTTWLAQPATDSATQISVPHTSLSSLDVLDINVKPMVDSMRASGNYGLKIALQNEGNNNVRTFGSSKNADAAKRPKLVLVYQ
jgi:hypothetical protein